MVIINYGDPEDVCEYDDDCDGFRSCPSCKGVNWCDIPECFNCGFELGEHA